MTVKFGSDIRGSNLPIGTEYLTQTSARLWVLALQFLTTAEDDSIHMLQVYRVACELIHFVSNQDEAVPDFSSCLPHYFSRTVFTSAHCILRICKSHLRQQLDVSDMETAFFSAVGLLKKLSIQTNDLEARNTVILTQLWSSNKAFVRKGFQQNGLRVDIRDRLVGLRYHTNIDVNTDAMQGASPAFDNFRWWRAEFGTPSVAKVNAIDAEHLRRCEEMAQSAQNVEDAPSAQMQMSDHNTDTHYSQDQPTSEESETLGFIDWDSIMMDNDFMNWTNWPSSAFDYGTILEMENMSAESIHNAGQYV